MKVLFFICLFGVLHTYLIFPLLMRLLGLFKLKSPLKAGSGQPTVEIIFAAYNEAQVIEAKIRSCFECDYPIEKISVQVGSDASNDGTDQIIGRLQEKYPGLKLSRFKGRTGKTGIINQLTARSEAELLLLTDANIIFDRHTLPTLVARLQQDKAGIVGGHILYQQPGRRGISQQENLYLRWENKLKELESRLFGKAMGVEGGIYLIRRELFPAIPRLYFMEDFYVSLSVMTAGEKVLFEPAAVCYEDVSVLSSEEYKRKLRISIGNFQNLKSFWRPMLRRFWPAGFLFFSHKVLRWCTPFFLLLLLPLSTLLTMEGIFFGLFAGFYMLFIGLGLFGILFSQSQKAGLLKYPGHFIHMNLALLEGFSIFIKGVDSNVWEPTRRNQE